MRDSEEHIVSKGFEKNVSKKNQKSSWQARKNMIWCKSCCGSYEERVNKINQKSSWQAKNEVI